MNLLVALIFSGFLYNAIYFGVKKAINDSVLGIKIAAELEDRKRDGQ